MAKPDSARRNQSGFSILTVLIMSSLASAALLALLKMTLFSSKSVQRSEGYAHFVSLIEQTNVALRPLRDPNANDAAKSNPRRPEDTINACTWALQGEPAGLAVFNTPVGAVTPVRLWAKNHCAEVPTPASPNPLPATTPTTCRTSILNPSQVLIDPTNANARHFGRLRVITFSLVSEGLAPGSATQYMARLLVEAELWDPSKTDASPDTNPIRFATNATGTSTGNRLEIWVLLTVVAGKIMDCSSNFFQLRALGTPIPPRPLPECPPNQVLYSYARDGDTTNINFGQATDIKCVKMYCTGGGRIMPTIPIVSTEWTPNSGAAADRGNVICPLL